MTTTNNVKYSYDKKLWSGVTFDELKNDLDNRDYKNEKKKEQIQQQIIKAFQSADSNNDNMISEEEFKSYNKNVMIKDAFKGLAIGIGATLVGAGVFLGVRTLQMKFLLKALDDIDIGKIVLQAVENINKNIK